MQPFRIAGPGQHAGRQFLPRRGGLPGRIGAQDRKGARHAVRPPHISRQVRHKVQRSGLGPDSPRFGRALAQIIVQRIGFQQIRQILVRIDIATGKFGKAQREEPE